MKDTSRREFLKEIMKTTVQVAGPPALILTAGPPVKKVVAGPVERLFNTLFNREEHYDYVPPPNPAYDASKHDYGYAVNTGVCIGCGRCVNACKVENHIPMEKADTRTWVERYFITEDREVFVDSPEGGRKGFKHKKEILSGSNIAISRSFFVPKLCNQCSYPPCVQVCPVGATYKTEDGIVLVDRSRCVGCGYCVQVCPYGARFFHSRLKVADKCTWCYPRITRGKLPACVGACPRHARLFGDLHDPQGTVRGFLRSSDIYVLKEELGTKPKVFYKGYRMGVV